MKQSIVQPLGLVVVLSVLVLRGPALLSHMWANAGLMMLSQAQITVPDVQVPQVLAQAETLLLQASAFAPENRFAWWGLGFTLAAQKREEEAMTAWQTGDGMVEEFTQRGEALRAARQYEEALAWYERAAVLAPDSAKPWYYKGLAYEGMQKWEEALRAHEQAVELEPSGVQPYYAMGNILLYKHRDDEKALRVYRAAAALDRPGVMAYLGIGTALDRLQREEEALLAYQEATRLSYQVVGDTTEGQRDRVWPHYVLGDFYLRQGQLEEAARSYDNALAQDTDNHWAGWSLWALGRIALQKRQYNGARGYFLQTLQTPTVETSPYLRSQACLGIAEVFIQQGDVVQGIDYLHRAHDQDPDNKGLHRYLADSFRQAGMYGDAIEEYERYLQKWPNDQAVIQALEESQQATDSR